MSITKRYVENSKGVEMSFEEIKLDKKATDPLYVQLYNILREKIIKSELKPNSKLPPIRKLAKKLSANNSTIVKAYNLLEEENYVYKKIGSGTYVKELNVSDDYLENSYIEYKSGMINFGSGTPSEELFPVESFKKYINEVLDFHKGKAFGYKDSKGDVNLRRLIFNKLASEFDISKEQIQIISGAQQGIDIVSKTLLRSNDHVIVEAPTYTGAIAIFNSRGAKISSVPINYAGVDLDELERKVKRYKPKLFFTMPVFHNPTGYSYTHEEKKRLLELAEKYNFYIIEDDYASELNFSSKKLQSLKSMDENDRVIYIKSFSKIFLPGLRLGYLVAPKKLERQISLAKHTSDISTSGLLQKTFESFLRNEEWDQQLNKMYSIFKEKFELTVKLLDENLPRGVEYNKPYGGVNIWLYFDEEYNIKEVYKYLLENNVLIAPGDIFFFSEKQSNNIRISIASIRLDQLEHGIRRLCDLLEEFLYDESSFETKPIL